MKSNYFTSIYNQKTNPILAFAIVFLISVLGYSQNAADPAILFKSYPNFSKGNILNPTLNNSGEISTVNSTVEQTDGKILAFGHFTNFKEESQRKLVRLNADGTKDTSFNIGTGFEHIPALPGQVDCFLNAAVQLADGKILVGGYFNRFNGSVQNGLIKLNADGTKDNSFNIGTAFTQGSFPGNIQKIIVLNDGKLLISGGFLSFNGTANSGLIKLNADGTIDSSFTLGVNLYGVAGDIVVQADGKILVGDYGSNSLTPKIRRLNANGSLDTTFNVGAGFDNAVREIVLQPDGKILVSGFFSTYKGASVNKLVRLNSDASLDLNFSLVGQNSTLIQSGISRVFVTSSNKIVVTGNFATYNGTAVSNMIRLNLDGTLDFQYTIPNAELVSHFAFLQSGKILVQGKYLYKMNPDSSLDETFDLAEGFDLEVRNIEVATGNKLFISGSFDTFKGYSHKGLVKLNPDGKRDFSFARGLFAGGTISLTKLQPDGKLLVGGTFTTFNGVAVKKIVRLNADGSLDNTFNAGGTGVLNFSGGVFSISVQSDGKIVIGGSFTIFFTAGPSLGKLVRLNADGTMDTTFNNGTNVGINGDVIANLQPDGKILVTGSFDYVMFTNYNRIMRFNANGTLDTTFVIGTGFNNQTTQSITQPDGKIVVIGQFTNYNGTAVNRIVRLNANGSVDTTFSIGTGFNTNPLSIALQNDNKIVAVGNFSTYNGVSQNKIAVLNADGTLDTTFNSGTGFFSLPLTVKIDNTGAIWAGGGLYTYNNAVNNYLIKLNGTAVPLSTENVISSNKTINLKLYPNPTSGNFNIQINQELIGSKVTVHNILGQKIKEFQLDGLTTNQNLEKGIYIFEIEKDGNKTSRKLIVN